MDSNIPLTPSYLTTLLKYQKAVELRAFEAIAIKARETIMLL